MWTLLLTSDAQELPIPNCAMPSAQRQLEGVPDFTKGSPFYREYGDPASPFSRHPQNFMTPVCSAGTPLSELSYRYLAYTRRHLALFFMRPDSLRARRAEGHISKLCMTFGVLQALPLRSFRRVLVRSLRPLSTASRRGCVIIWRSREESWSS